MRRLYTTAELHELGLTQSAMRWAVKKGRLSPVMRGVYAEGQAKPSPLDKGLAVVLATGGIASGTLCGVLLDLDGVELQRPDVTVSVGSSPWRAGVRRRDLPSERVITAGGVRCTDALQTLVDLAKDLDDHRWEQSLECALRRHLTAVADVEDAGRRVERVRRVLALRPPGAPPTESLLETLMVQLARRIEALPQPSRQLQVFNPHGELVARVDLAWPGLGLFIELDGQHHLGQPVYDASRETAIVAATGWLCGRFTWQEVARHPISTARRLEALADQARRRPMAG